MGRKRKLRSSRSARQYLQPVLVVFFIAEWALMWGLWALFVGNFQGAELALGAGAALIAAFAATALEAANFARFAPHWAELAQAWRLPWYLIKGTWEIFVVLVHHLLTRRAPSLVTAIKFDAVGDDAHSAGRRALAVVLMTVPPDSVAIGIDRRKHELILHQFRLGGVPAMAYRLGAKP